ncbi:hypothetical protein HQ489_05250 [Candidatus Woesearchaeota archaeon]|nr:hypothetical protein [Candidatus Woesearchaeota archaeon]
MPTYRVTEKKIQEYLGEGFGFELNPFKTLQMAVVFLSVGIALLIVLINGGLIAALKVVVVGFFIVALMYFMIKKGDYNYEPYIKELVNDQKLLWLNNQDPFKTVKKWNSSNKGNFTPTTFKILAYLKKEGTIQGMYKKIRTMKNSNSAYQATKRLADKNIFNEPIVKQNGNDFAYVPWKFNIVDETNCHIKGKGNIEHLLQKVWEKMLDQEI